MSVLQMVTGEVKLPASTALRSYSPRLFNTPTMPSTVELARTLSATVIGMRFQVII